MPSAGHNDLVKLEESEFENNQSDGSVLVHDTFEETENEITPFSKNVSPQNSDLSKLMEEMEGLLEENEKLRKELDVNGMEIERMKKEFREKCGETEGVRKEMYEIEKKLVQMNELNPVAAFHEYNILRLVIIQYSIE